MVGVCIDDLRCLIDIHLHLDGSLSVPIVRRLAKMQGIALPASEEELLSLLSVSDGCRDLNAYLKKFDFPCSLLQTAESLREAAYLLAEELREEGYMYAEIRFAPQHHLERGLTQKQVVCAVMDGLHRSSLKTSLIICCMRGEDKDRLNLETVRIAEEFLHRGVEALDLAGAEALYPNEQYADLFAAIREKGIPFTIHAGEASGPESVRSALAFGAGRIGHGVRSAEDETLLRELSEGGITLELCPTSNLHTAVAARLEDWPLRKLMAAGAKVTINTDNRSVSATTMKKELQKTAEAFNLTAAELAQLLTNAVEASFAPEKWKEEFRAKIAAAFC